MFPLPQCSNPPPQISCSKPSPPSSSHFEFLKSPAPSRESSGGGRGQGYDSSQHKESKTMVWLNRVTFPSLAATGCAWNVAKSQQGYFLLDTAREGGESEMQGSPFPWQPHLQCKVPVGLDFHFLPFQPPVLFLWIVFIW